MTTDQSSTARLDVPLATVLADLERLRLSLPVDDRDRHTLDTVADDAFAHLAPGYPVAAGEPRG